MTTTTAATAWPEHKAKAALAAWGIPVPPSTVLLPGEPLPQQPPIPYPVAVKVSSPRVLHKTELGALHLGVHTDRSFREAVVDLRRRFPEEAILVEAMERPGVEVIVGAMRDPVFGLCLMLGTGGILAELYEDVAFRRLPVDVCEVEAMLDELRGGALLKGFRGIRADRAALVNLVVRVGAWLEHAAPPVAQMDLNPVLVRDDGAVVVDAKLLLQT